MLVRSKIAGVFLLTICFVFVSCNDEKEENKPSPILPQLNTTEEGQDSTVKEIIPVHFEADTLASQSNIHVDSLSHRQPAQVLKKNGVYYAVAKDSIYRNPVRIEVIDWFKYETGEPIIYTDLPSSTNLNTRLWLTAFFNDFTENDYLTGEELALYYKHNQGMNLLARTAMANFFKHHIARIVRQDNRLIIRTVHAEVVKTTFKIPLLVSFSLEIKNGSSIRFGETIVSEEALFSNWHLLPIRLEGIQIVQNNDTIPSEGYVYNNSYFVNYPHSQLNYQFKK